MRTVAWLVVVVAIGAIARADTATGTVVISCNEADASLIVDDVLIPERTPAVLTLPAGPHVIEARKPPFLPDRKLVQVGDQQQIKVRFELVPPAPPPPPPEPATASGSGAGSGSGSGSGAGSNAGPGAGSNAGPGASASPVVPPPPVPVSAPVAPPPRCTEGGREVACLQGPHCTEGGRPVPCTKGGTLPPTTPPVAPGTTAKAVAGTGSAGANAPPEPPRTSTGAATVDVVTTAAHAIAYLDGAPIHEAPCVLEVEPGEHVVAVYTPGMVPAEALVRVAAGQQQRVELTPSTPRRRIDVPAP